MGKEVVVDINSCDAGKILHVFKKIGNCIGSNINGDDHQVQQAFLTEVHRDWVATKPSDPREKMLAAMGEAAPIRVKLEEVSNLAIIRFEVQVKNHTQTYV